MINPAWSILQLSMIFMLGWHGIIRSCFGGARPWNVELLRFETLLYQPRGSIAAGKRDFQYLDVNSSLLILLWLDWTREEWKRDSQCNQTSVHNSTSLGTSFRTISLHALRLRPWRRTIYLHATKRHFRSESLVILHQWNHIGFRVSSFVENCLS